MYPVSNYIPSKFTFHRTDTNLIYTVIALTRLCMSMLLNLAWCIAVNVSDQTGHRQCEEVHTAAIVMHTCIYMCVGQYIVNGRCSWFV